MIIDSKDYNEINTVPSDLPAPISRENPLFTNPDFLAKINDDIKKFSLQTKNSYTSTQISRQNSNFITVSQSHQNLPINPKITF